MKAQATAATPHPGEERECKRQSHLGWVTNLGRREVEDDPEIWNWAPR